MDFLVGDCSRILTCTHRRQRSQESSKERAWKDWRRNLGLQRLHESAALVNLATAGLSGPSAPGLRRWIPPHPLYHCTFRAEKTAETTNDPCGASGSSLSREPRNPASSSTAPSLEQALKANKPSQVTPFPNFDPEFPTTPPVPACQPTLGLSTSLDRICRQVASGIRRALR